MPVGDGFLIDDALSIVEGVDCPIEWITHFEFAWAWGPPIDMKMGLSCACTLMERGRRRSVYTLDPVRPFLSLIRNVRFEPICVAPLLPEAGTGST